MPSPIYLLSAVAAICGMYLLWALGIRKLLLDGLRERIFELRFELFRLGADDAIEFENPAYRALETLFCGLLRYSHRITFLSFLISKRASNRAEKEKDYVNVSAQIALKVSQLQPETQERILEILKGVQSILMIYIACSSLLFLSILAVYKVLDILGIRHLKEAQGRVVDAIEREAYLAESRRSMQLAMA
jgi:hypothetical protein